jgi:rare lipoprotein A
MKTSYQWLVGALTVAGFLAMNGVPNPARATDVDPHPAAKVGPASPDSAAHLDRSGRKRVGKASFYAKEFAGKTMADGTPMHPQGNNAASKTLPLGTTAMVTNLETGRTAIVTIRDRGPYVDGRIVDLSPATAQKIGLGRKEGVAKVEVAPIEVPQTDGTIKPGVPETKTPKRESTGDALSAALRR